MDPNQCIEHINDTEMEPVERVLALDDLFEWVKKDGYLPTKKITVEAIDTFEEYERAHPNHFAAPVSRYVRYINTAIDLNNEERSSDA